MTRERPKSPRVRLFVALDLPERITESLTRWQAQATAAEPALRTIAPQNLHLTLAFLGYRDEGEVERVESILGDVVALHSAPLLRISREPAGKPPRRPSLIAAELSGEGLGELAEAVGEALASERLLRRERRPFWGHVTLARVRPQGRGSRRPARLEGSLPALDEAAREPFHAVRVALYRSNLRPQGARYASLARFELPTTRPDQR